MNLTIALRRRLRSAFFIAALATLAAPHVEAKTTHIGDGYPNLGRGIRPLGMGNAFLTMEGTDENAMFYNPAALQDFEKSWRYSVMSPGASFSKSLYTTVKDVFDLSRDLKNAPTDNSKIGIFQTFFNKHVGEFQSIELRLPIFSMMRKGWAIGVLADSRSTVSMRNRAFPNFELRSRNDGAVVLGKSFGLLGDDLSVGVLAKGIYRTSIDRIIVTSDILANNLGDIIGYKQWGKQYGGGADIGVRYKLPVFGLNPAVAVTYQDVGKTRFTGATTDDTPQSINAGVGIHPTFGEFETSIEVDMTQLNERRDLLTRLHAGAEVRFPWLGAMRLSVRGGTNQGYPAGGFSIDFKKVRVDGAFYGEEIGEFRRQGKTYKFAGEFALVF